MRSFFIWLDFGDDFCKGNNIDGCSESNAYCALLLIQRFVAWELLRNATVSFAITMYFYVNLNPVVLICGWRTGEAILLWGQNNIGDS